MKKLIAIKDQGKIIDWTKKKLVINNAFGDNFLNKWLIGFFKPFTTSSVTWIIIVMMLGIRTSEKTGFFNVTILKFVKSIPDYIVTPLYFMLCVTSSIATDVGYLLLIPLGGLIWKSIGKNPIAGIATAFAGVSGGFGAALFIGGVDVLLIEMVKPMIQQEIIKDHLNPSSHFYFIIGSTILLTIVGWLTATFIIEPLVEKLYPLKNQDNINKEFENINKPITSLEKRGLLFASLSGLIFIIFLLMNKFIPGGFLNNFEIISNNEIKVINPLLESINLILTLLFLIMGLVYGFVTKFFKSKYDFYKTLLEIIKEQCPFFLTIIGALVFINLFTTTGLSNLISNMLSNGIEFLNIQNSPILILVIFIFAVSIFNLFSAGLTSKLLMIGPIFIPLFIDLGIHPIVSLAAFRLGESPTNIITPLLVYLPLIISFAHSYLNETDKKRFQIGSIISIMLPYAIIILVSWTLFFVAWYYFQIPFGPSKIDVYDISSLKLTTFFSVNNLIK